MSGWLGALILQAGSSLICWEPLIRERELQARLPFCFQDQLTLKWLLQSPFYSHFFFLPSLSVQALESNTHMVLWLGCLWKADSLKKKNDPPTASPNQPSFEAFFPPPDSRLWACRPESLLLCPGCAGKAVKMSDNQSFREKRWAWEGRRPVTKHTPFMECWY